MTELWGRYCVVLLEEEDAAEMLGQSRGTGPIMYLLLERWEKKKTETGMRGPMAEIAMGMRERDWRSQVWRERTGRCRFENQGPDSDE